MDFGRISVFAGLIASLSAVVLYTLAIRGNRGLLLAARSAFAVTVLSVFACFGRLMFLVSQHKFQFDYVFRYSSADLGFPWKYAATWAGQEGSFLLWAFWTAVIGVLVAWKAGKWEARVMPFYISTLCFLFGILVWLSPYNQIVRGIGPSDYPLDLPWPPGNGQGLNPSLQNYWMAIHPPTIFFGFASLAVPFVYALAAMIRRDYESWAQRVMPYVLMTIATLGVGLFMGGYWAYETQGWHGFWAWDPVENASLFPWLGSLGLLHGLVVQRSRGGMGRTNIFLSIVSWLLFLYGTFLTRSGVLASFSVHAFDMLRKDALALLIWMIVTHGLLGFILLLWRWKTIPGRASSDKPLSRDTAMVLAISIMMMAAAIVAIGTSWPLLSRWGIWKSIPYMNQLYSENGMRAEPIFYNKAGSALLIPILLIMGAVPFLAWGKTNAEKFLWKVLVPWLSAIGVGALIVWFALSQESGGFRPETPRMLVVTVGMLGAFAAISNILLAVRLLRVKAVTMGGWTAHVGIGVLIIGTVLTNVYEQTKTYWLLEGAAPVRTPFGYTLEYAGWTHDGKSQEIAQKEWYEFDHSMKINVLRTPGEDGVAHADSGSAPPANVAYTALTPVFRQHSLQMAAMRDEESQKYMYWPSIHKELSRDFYIAVASDPELIRPQATLKEGQTDAIRRMDLSDTADPENKTSNTLILRATNYAVTYKKFYMHGAPGQPGTAMGGEMVLHMPDGRNLPFNAEVMFSPEGGLQPTVTEIPGVNAVALIKGRIDPATKEINVNFELPDVSPVWRAPIAVTNKPWINLVWLGVVLMGLGTLCAMVRRSIEARKGSSVSSVESQGEADDEIAASASQAGEGTKGPATGSARQKPARPARAKG